LIPAAAPWLDLEISSPDEHGFNDDEDKEGKRSDFSRLKMIVEERVAKEGLGETWGLALTNALAGWMMKNKPGQLHQVTELLKLEGAGEFPAKEAVEKAGIRDQKDPKLESITQEIYSAEFARGKMHPEFGGKERPGGAG
jgi:hypothetical protein